MKRIIGIIAILAGILLLSGCGDSIDYGNCLSSHTEQGYPIYVKVGNIMVPVPQTNTVCDVWQYPEGRPL